MSLRAESERVLRSWDAYEVGRGTPSVIDFDCHPTEEDVSPAANRLAVHAELTSLADRAESEGNERLVDRLNAHLAYLEALMGARMPLGDYVRITQGCGAAGWPADYVTAVGDTARAHLEALGVPWNKETYGALDAIEESLDPQEAPEAIRAAANELEKDVRETVDSVAPFDLSIELVDLDAYWAYWLDGRGARVRMRINPRNARFTKVQARQFALHEILGHGLQGASYSHRCANSDVEWVRMTSVHAQQQVLFEGLAQALPLFITPHDKHLIARVRLAHYLELVKSEIHLSINAGVSVSECVAQARRRVPFWSDSGIADLLSDRAVDPLLRSYLWSYPAGIDWFVRLASEATSDTVAEILHLAYWEPLTPADLARAWPSGPPIGGPGAD